MDIKLYYVEGISKEDTPYFSTIGEQEQYFEDREVISIKDTWYPPYYKNKIKLEVTDDLNVNTRVNYLSFDYQGKEYYYFITAVHYHSEEVFSVDIEMDTIQTFMFNFELTSAIIERQHINRWKKEQFGTKITWTINRDYLRENVSRGNFIVHDRKFYEDWSTAIGQIVEPRGWIVLNFTGKNSYLPSKENNIRWTSPYDDSVTYPTQYNQVFIPVGENFDSYYVDSDTSTTATCEMVNSLKAFSSQAKLAFIYYIPLSPFDAPSFIKVGSRLCFNKNLATQKGWQTDHDSTNPIIGAVTSKNLSSPNDYPYNHKLKPVEIPNISSYVRDFADIPNHLDTHDIFDTNYIPSLLDENYIRVSFGEDGAMSYFPLYQATNTNLTGVYYADMTSGVRYYNLLPEGSDMSTDLYHTLVVARTPLYVEALTSAWSEWRANNVGTVLMANVNAIRAGFKGVANAYGGNLGGNTNVLDEYAPVIRRGVNAMFAPPQVLSTGSYFGDYLANMSRISAITEVVDDIEQCAQYYHRFGNLVNKYIDTTVSLFADVNTRYYFNYVKMSDCVVHLIHYIEADDITESIKDRLTSGIRLWNVDKTSIGNYTYDNVEKAFIQ